MTTTKIPDQIIREAEKCVKHFRINNDHLWIEFVARALMARDQRAADIARKQADGSDHSHGYEVACEDIAAAILTYSAKEPS